MEERDMRAELIEKIARVLVSNDASWIAKVYLETFKPISTLSGIFMYIPTFLIFEALGPWGHEFGTMLIDNPEENIDRILEKITELEEEKAKYADTTLSNWEKYPALSNIRNWIKGKFQRKVV